MVRVVVDGAMRVRKIEIDLSIAAADDDKAMMEDLIVPRSTTDSAARRS